jgi:hypothetical protein
LRKNIFLIFFTYKGFKKRRMVWFCLALGLSANVGRQRNNISSFSSGVGGGGGVQLKTVASGPICANTAGDEYDATITAGDHMDCVDGDNTLTTDKLDAFWYMPSGSSCPSGLEEIALTSSPITINGYDYAVKCGLPSTPTDRLFSYDWNTHWVLPQNNEKHYLTPGYCNNPRFTIETLYKSDGSTPKTYTNGEVKKGIKIACDLSTEADTVDIEIVGKLV